jgi:tetratricopeptide (TPR) repeat protein
MMRYLFHKPGLLLMVVCGATCCRLWGGDLPATDSPPVSTTTDSTTAPGLGQLPTPGTVQTKAAAIPDSLQKMQIQLEMSREQRRQKNTALAAQTLTTLLASEPPPEIKRLALFELALVAQDENKLVLAQQIFGQYLHNYYDDASAPEVLLRQGLIYRQMGVNNLAISKFYAVMSTALKLKLENMDYYKKLVLQAQIEIADTYYQEGKYDEAADFFSRLLRTGNPDLDQIQTQYKLVRSFSCTTNSSGTIAQAQIFLNLYPNATEAPEVRFFLASSLKKVGRNNDAMRQVLLLLQNEQDNAHKNPELWTYWQQRAGNEIANQLYKEGDYLSALQINLSLAELDKSPAWQVPAWYQAALIYEQLQQWQKASQTYQHILDRQKEVTDAISTPSLVSVFEMAKWRKDYIDWLQKAKTTQQSFLLTQATNSSAITNP